ncbi:MAG TPA: GTPase domain-containing protein [Longimicrobium sp.]|nr:GTPase domain-containing protein [Longimicrobium sp.]
MFLLKHEGVMNAEVAVTLFLGVLTLVLGWKTHELQERLGQRSLELQQEQRASAEKIQQLREYIKSIRFFDFQYLDVVFFGPRQSGKTSIVELWATPWTDVRKLKPSPDWSCQEITVHEFEEELRPHPLIEATCTYVPTLRVRLHDYPGEDGYRLQAIQDLRALTGKSVVLFVFHVGYHNGRITHSERNAEYYSTVFVEEIRDQLENVTRHIQKAIIVFNKVDTLPREWDDDFAMTELKQANASAIVEIARVFSGKLEFRLTSSLTNKGLVELLGATVSSAIPVQAERERFEENLRKLSESFATIKH